MKKEVKNFKMAITNYSEILKEILKGIENKNFAVFCGAGISRNSGLPLVDNMKQEILEKLTDNKEDIEKIKNSNLPFEAFMEILSENSDISKILEIFKQGEPNTDHILIAKLAKKGLIKTIATTNFDMLIEKALEKEGLKRGEDFDVYFREEQFSEIDFDALNKNDRISIFKIHGSIEDEKSIRTTMKAVASRLLSEKRRNVIKHIFSNKSHKNVLILGYSCSDIFDITPQIQSINNSKSRIFFINHNKDEGKKELSQIESIKTPTLKNDGKEKENPFKNFDGYILNHDTDKLVEDIWNSLIKENKIENKKEINWRDFIREWSYNVRRDKKYSICGKIFYNISEFKKAIEYFKKSLEINKGIKDKVGEARGYINLGIAYNGLGYSKKAIECFEKCLGIINLEIVNKDKEIKEILAKCYINLGIAYEGLDDFKKAIDYSKKSLEINKEIGDKGSESKCYINLGNIYNRLGDSRKAIYYSKKSLKISKKIGDKVDESICYGNLSIAYNSLGNLKKALEYSKKFLEINAKIVDKVREPEVYMSLGFVYSSLGISSFNRAIEYYKKSLEINKDTGNKSGESRCYLSLGIIYSILGDFDKAIDCFKKSLEINKEIRNRIEEAKMDLYLGIAYTGLCDFNKAIKFYLKAEKIFKETGQKHYLKTLYENMATTYEKMNNPEKAEEYKNKMK